MKTRNRGREGEREGGGEVSGYQLFNFWGKIPGTSPL